MFRSRLTFEEYLKSVENEAAAGEDVSLDDPEVISDLADEEEEDEINEENALDSMVSVNYNPALVSIPEDFSDDQEVLIIDERGNARKSRGRVSVNTVHKLVPPERIMVPLNNLLQPIKKAGSLFNRFIADLAKRSNLCPLNYDDWRLVNPYFRGRIIMVIRRKFMLPDGVDVNRKVLSSVGEKVRGYKYSLRCKYLKEGTTKEELFNLDSSKRPSTISDQMWVDLVEHFFSEKFQKFSANGKIARGKQLHRHTNGSESFAIKKDKFEQQHQREPGPLEWFVETHKRKDDSYSDPVTEKFVDSAMSIIRKKTGCSEVVFSESTVPVETLAYRKLMGPESNGRVRGYGYGVAPSKVHGKRKFQSGTGASESSVISILLKEVRSLRQEVTDLKSKRGDAQDQHECISLEEDQRTDTRLDDGVHVRQTPQTMSRSVGIRNSTVLSDTSEMRHTSGLLSLANQQRRSARGKENVQLNSIQGINKSSKSQIGKKRVSMTNETENSTFVTTAMQAKTNTSLTHDGSERVCIQGTRNSPILSPTSSLFSREPNSEGGNRLSAINGQTKQPTKSQSNSIQGMSSSPTSSLFSREPNSEGANRQSAINGKTKQPTKSQSNCIQGMSSSPILSSTPSPFSRETNREGGNRLSAINGQTKQPTKSQPNYIQGMSSSPILSPTPSPFSRETNREGGNGLSTINGQTKQPTRSQSNCTQGISNSPILSPTPSPFSRETNRDGGNRLSVINGQTRQSQQPAKSQEEMRRMSAAALKKPTSTAPEFGSSFDVVSRNGCHRLVGSGNSEQVHNSAIAEKGNEGDTSNLRPSNNIPNKQLNQIQHKQKEPVTNQLDGVEIEMLVDKVLHENPEPVRNFKNPRRREFVHCYLGGLAMGECKRKADPDLLNNLLWEKLFATTKSAGCP